MKKDTIFHLKFSIFIMIIPALILSFFMNKSVIVEGMLYIYLAVYAVVIIIFTKKIISRRIEIFSLMPRNENKQFDKKTIYKQLNINQLNIFIYVLYFIIGLLLSNVLFMIM